MLKFCRTKFVGFERESDDILKIYGTLDDTLYSMQIEIKLQLPELVIQSLTGKMRRFTTPFCEEATNFLTKGAGLKIEPGFQSKVKRLIGRPGCRHFANLINECCESIIPALICMKYKELHEENPEISIAEVIKEVKETYPQIASFCPTYSSLLEK